MKKKRAFLSPLAASVAALLSVGPAMGATNPAADVTQAKTETAQQQARAIDIGFVIERNGAPALETAQHYSHMSHSSHSSHQSHYSSRY
jgi:hypothetical protein